MDKFCIYRITGLVLTITVASAAPVVSLPNSLEDTNPPTRDYFARAYHDYQLDKEQVYLGPSSKIEPESPRMVSPLDLNAYANYLSEEPSDDITIPSHQNPLPKPGHKPTVHSGDSLCFYITGHSASASHINHAQLRLTTSSTPSFKTPHNHNLPPTAFHLSKDGTLAALPSGDVLAAPSHPSGGEWAHFVSAGMTGSNSEWYPRAICSIDERTQRLSCSHPQGANSGQIPAEDEIPLELSVLRGDYCSFSGENASVSEEVADWSDPSYGSECAMSWWPMWGTPGFDGEDGDFKAITLTVEEADCTV